MTRHNRTCGRCKKKTRAMMFACPWSKEWREESLCRNCATEVKLAKWRDDEIAEELARFNVDEMWSLYPGAVR